MKSHKKIIKTTIFWLGSALIMYYLARVNYLLFHALVEGFAIIVAVLIYVLGTRTYQHSRNNMFLFLGISYFFVAILDFAHLLTYKGMGVFPNYGTDTPTQLWIAGRLMEAAALFVVLFLQKRTVRRRLVSTVYALVTGALILSIMVFEIFPVCFVEGEGLTFFKISSEYIIITLLLVGAYILYQRQEQFELGAFSSVGWAMIITAVSELAFTLYTDVYGVFNMLGHMLKIVSYYFIYLGVVTQGIDAPYSLMAKGLREGAIKDSLTGLRNRQGLLELMEQGLADVRQEKIGFGVLMIDLDDFKLINDAHGHLFGDRALKSFATILKENIRENDHACRFGGDEFIVLAREVDYQGLLNLKLRIQKAFNIWKMEQKELHKLGISIGISLLTEGQDMDVNSLLKQADQDMYADKQRKK